MEKQIIKVLLIEDDPDDILLIREMLLNSRSSRIEFQVENATRLEDGLSRLSTEDYDVVLLDPSLPDSQGRETIDKGQLHLKELPIIVLTGLDDSLFAVDVMSLGAQDYLVKGEFDGKTLSRVIRYAVERKKLLRVKDDFINTISHELRTPLTVIQGSIENLKDGILGKLAPEQTAVIETVHRNVMRLSRIIQDLLDLSHLESGRMRINRCFLNPLSLIHEVVQNFRNQADAKHLHIKEDVPPHLPDLNVDPDLLTQVLNNLIDNALRFARSEITVKAALLTGGGEFIQVSVEDDGMGIPKEKIGQLFHKFVQLNRPTGGGGYKGTGLGLSISKNIVDLHAGKIWVDSEEGRKTCFYFTIPVISPIISKEEADSHNEKLKF